MSNILLYKQNFSILNSHTSKGIPFLYNGDKLPNYIRVSDEEIPLSAANRSLTTAEMNSLPGYDRSTFSPVTDDWDRVLDRSDFTGNHLQVSGVALSEIIASRKNDWPSDVHWNNLTMTKSGNDMVISDYDDGQGISQSAREIFYPWRSNWGQVNIEKDSSSLDLHLSLSGSVMRILEGVVRIEPTDRRWTNTVNVQPSYNYPYSPGTYDLQVTATQHPGTSYAGVYKILNTSAVGIDRKWILDSTKRAICWNSSNKCWQLIGYSSANASANTINTTGSYLSVQYLKAFDDSWFFGSYPTGTTKTIQFTNIGTNVCTAHGIDPFSNWSMGEAEDPEGDQSKIKIHGTRFMELAQNSTGYLGNWTNSVKVVADGSDLVVSGFSSLEVNGTYSLFHGSGDSRIWVKGGSVSKYSISYDSSSMRWELCTTVDGSYSLTSGTATGVFRTWTDSQSGFSNIICFSRYENSWHIKNCRSMTLEFIARNPDGSAAGTEEGFNIFWRSSSGDYSLRYSSEDYCWKMHDSAGNMITCQNIRPGSWDDFDTATDYENTIIDWSQNKVIMDGAPFHGDYTTEQFNSTLHPFSMAKDDVNLSYYATYDMAGSRWKLVVRLAVDGEYALDDSSKSMETRIWEKLDSSSQVESSYKIVYNTTNSRWELIDYSTPGNSYDHSSYGSWFPLPIEGSWGTGKIIEGTGTSISVSSFSGWSDATGSYSQSTLTSPNYAITRDQVFLSGKNYFTKTGETYELATVVAGEIIPPGSHYEIPEEINRQWTRTGTDGKYRVAWSNDNQNWILEFINAAINTTYAYSAGATRSLDTWTKIIGSATYSISWDSTAARWTLEQGSSVVSFSDSTTADAITQDWASPASVSASGEDLVVSGLADSEANGLYAVVPNPGISSDFQKTWTKISSDGTSLYTILFDMSNLRWRVRSDDLDINGQYHPYPLDSQDAGYDRRWSHRGVKSDSEGNIITYLICHSAASSRWEIRRLVNYLNTQDATAQSGKDYYVYVSGAQAYGKLTAGVNYTTGGTTATGNVSISGTSYDIGTIYIQPGSGAHANDHWLEHVPELVWQTTADDEPTGGVWSSGEVIDPFADSSVLGVGVRYTPPEEQQYDIVVNADNWYYDLQTRYIGTYVLQDPDSRGANRVWKSSSNMYIKWISSSKIWVITSNININSIDSAYYDQNYEVCAWSQSGQAYADVPDISTLSWSTNSNSFYGSARVSSKRVDVWGDLKRFWMMAVYTETEGSTTRHVTSNLVSFWLSTMTSNIVNVSLSLVGSSGNPNYTGFYKSNDPSSKVYGTYAPTDLITVNYSAYSPNQIRIKFDGVTIPDVDLDHDHAVAHTLSKTGILDQTSLGGNDSAFEVTMTVRDEAGNTKTLSRKITHIARLWRMAGTSIKEDQAGYSTEVYSVTSTGGLMIIPKTEIDDSEGGYVRAWDDIFYPATHGYPKLEDGKIDEPNAIRISKPTIDETGRTGPTSAELKIYDRLTLKTDNSALSLDQDGRTMTSGWDRSKKYQRMESSSYGVSGENLRYWIIDNSGYSDLQLEFEYFDLSSQVSNIPRNNLSPYEGDVLVIYDASAEGCLGAETDMYGKVHQVLKDSSKLVEIYAFTGSHFNDDIAMRSDGASTFDLKDFGFITPKISSTSKLCLILYTDNDHQLSGFKIKAGPRHAAILHNYELKTDTGEIWIHLSPEVSSGRWSSPDRVATTHQYTTANAIVDHERSRVIFDVDAGSYVTADLTVYSYLKNIHDLGATSEDPSGEWITSNVAPKSNFRHVTSGSNYAYADVKSFLLYNDDCVDYYDISLCVAPSGKSINYSDLYDYMNPSKNFGKIVSGTISNKDKGMITFTSSVPLGRIFASYNYHTYYRLTNDGYGDLNFYENALIPSSDYSLTGLKDWTYVDLMIYNEGSNALSEGLMKFMSRGYISGSGTSQTITQVVDENRPWDVQSGTIAETVNRTGAVFNSSYTSLPAPTRARAIQTISQSEGGVSLGSVLAARSKAYMRIYWCLAQSESGGSVTYVTTTRGRKLWSSEISGKYYVVTM